MNVNQVKDELFDVLKKHYTMHVGYSAHEQAIEGIVEKIENIIGCKINDWKNKVEKIVEDVKTEIEPEKIETEIENASSAVESSTVVEESADSIDAENDKDVSTDA